MLMEKCGFEINDVSRTRLSNMHTKIAKQAKAKIRRKQKKRAIDLAHQQQFTDTSVKRRRLEDDEQAGQYVPSSISTKQF